MNRKKGFTLIELLIAATIIGMLAVFATTQYRNSAAEARWTQAKIKADQVATAVKQVALDYSTVEFSGTELIDTTLNACALTSGATSRAPSALISCGYLENAGWGKDYFAYYICPNGTGCSGDSIVCVLPRTGAALPNKYMHLKYCVDDEGKGVESTF